MTWKLCDIHYRYLATFKDRPVPRENDWIVLDNVLYKTTQIFHYQTETRVVGVKMDHIQLPSRLKLRKAIKK